MWWGSKDVELLDSSHEGLRNGIYFPAELRFMPS
jgi:hypothetical protein